MIVAASEEVVVAWALAMLLHRVFPTLEVMGALEGDLRSILNEMKLRVFALALLSMEAPAQKFLVLSI